MGCLNSPEYQKEIINEISYMSQNETMLQKSLENLVKDTGGIDEVNKYAVRLTDYYLNLMESGVDRRITSEILDKIKDIRDPIDLIMRIGPSPEMTAADYLLQFSTQ